MITIKELLNNAQKITKNLKFNKTLIIYWYHLANLYIESQLLCHQIKT